MTPPSFSDRLHRLAETEWSSRRRSELVEIAAAVRRMERELDEQSRKDMEDRVFAVERRDAIISAVISGKVAVFTKDRDMAIGHE